MQKIIQLLRKNKIEFIAEYQISDLRNGKMRYDLYLPRHNIAIEYNGQQHYIYNKHFFKSIGEWKKAQERDRQKCSYALSKKIDLYCVPFWQDINNLNDIFNGANLVTSKFHNDIAWRKHQKT